MIGRKINLQDAILAQVDMPYAFSQSSLNGFYSCPAKWALSRTNEYRSSPDTSHLRLGIMVHNTIDKHFKMFSGSADPEVLRRMIQNLFDSEWRTSGVYELESKYKKCVKSFIDFEIFRQAHWKEYKPTQTEYRFKYELDGFKYSGIVDLWGEEDSIMIDWKTSKDTKLNVSHLRQAEIYRRSKPNVKTVIFVCLGSGSILTAPAMPPTWLTEQTQVFADAIKSGVFERKRQWCRSCEEVWACEFNDVYLWGDHPW